MQYIEATQTVASLLVALPASDELLIHQINFAQKPVKYEVSGMAACTG